MDEESLLEKAKRIPGQLYQGFEHGAYEVNNQITGLEQAIFDKLGINTEKKKKRDLENIRKSTEFQKELEKTMGTPGKIVSFGTEMLPTALAGMSPAGAAAVGFGMTSGDTAQQQLKAHGELDPNSSLRSGVLSGVIDAGMKVATRGLSSRIPTDVDIIGRSVASNAASNKVSDVMTDAVGGQTAFTEDPEWEYILAELKKRKGSTGVLEGPL